MIRFLLSLCVLIVPASARMPAPADSSRTPVNVSIAYTNDDFVIENELNDLTGLDLFPANDDFVTVSLSLDARWRPTEVLYTGSLQWYALTDRWTGWRSDLALFESSAEFSGSGWRWTVGAGASIGGDLGGSSVQNGYHRLFGYAGVDLTYRSGYHYGVHVSGSAWKSIMAAEQQTLDVFVRLQPVIGSALPGHAETGLLWSRCGASYQTEVLAGYRQRFSVAQEYKRIFGSSFHAGALLAYRWHPAHAFSVWMTKNQFGVQNDLQFGLRFDLGLHDDRPFRYIRPSSL